MKILYSTPPSNAIYVYKLYMTVISVSYCQFWHFHFLVPEKNYTNYCYMSFFPISRPDEILLFLSHYIIQDYHITVIPVGFCQFWHLESFFWSLFFAVCWFFLQFPDRWDFDFCLLDIMVNYHKMVITMSLRLIKVFFAPEKKQHTECWFFNFRTIEILHSTSQPHAIKS